MKKLMKLMMVACLSLTVLSGCGSKESGDRLEQIKKQGYIVLGTSPDFAPNEFYIEENGNKKIVGSDIALAQAIADKIGVELKIQESDFNSVIANVQSGIVDMGISGFAWKQSRADVVTFSDDYSRNSDTSSYQGLMVRKDDVAKFTSKEDVKKLGITIGAQTGSIQYEMAQTLTDEKNIKALGDTTSCAGLLSTGDIDAFVITDTQAKALMQTYDNITILPKETFNMDPENKYNQTGAIVMKDSSTDSLLEVINEVIAEAKEKDSDGKSQLDKWYDEATELMPFELDAAE